MALVDSTTSTFSIYIYRGEDDIPEDSTHVTVDSSIRDIPRKAFVNCRNLRTVELPEGIQRIGACAFAGCKSLTTVNIPSTVVKIGKCAFWKCASLEEVVLPRGLISLGTEVFVLCTSLQSIVIPPQIQTIRARSFQQCVALTSVTLPCRLRAIECGAFDFCRSLSSMNFPSSFYEMGLANITPPDSVEDIGRCAFADCEFTNFRMPLRVTQFAFDIFNGRNNIVSLELSESIETVLCRDHGVIICSTAFDFLRNIAFPSGVEFRFNNETDIIASFKSLAKVFPDRDSHEVLDALKSRFEQLPIHKICYYYSYRDTRTLLINLKREINPWSGKFLGKLNETGKHQDCLGMNPLHILACSTKHDLEIIQLLVEKYPENLIAKDKWGDIPLLYALWCNAPKDVIQFLVESYKVNYPDYKFDWEGMIITMAESDTSISHIQNLMDVRQESFPYQKCDIKNVVITISKSIEACHFFQRCATGSTLRFLVHASILERIHDMNNSRWRRELEESVKSIPNCGMEIQSCTMAVYAKLEQFELLKEATSVLELALWKVAIDNRLEKKSRIGDGICYRVQCRVSCGADIVIQNVLPFL